MSIQGRKARILINKAGGNAGPEGRNYRVTLPAAWVKQLGVTSVDREVLLQFDGESITIRRAAAAGYDGFLAQARKHGHDLLILYFYDGDTLCTKICADRTSRQLAVENLTDDPLATAFGVNRSPSWEDLRIFLESRCVPHQRDGLSHYLSKLGLDRYDPLEIIRKTAGRMAEDHFWIKILEG